MRLWEFLKQEYKPVAHSHASTLLVGFVGGMLICLLTGPNVFPSIGNFMDEVFGQTSAVQSSTPLLVSKENAVKTSSHVTQPRRIAMLGWLETVFSKERVNALVR